MVMLSRKPFWVSFAQLHDEIERELSFEAERVQKEMGQCVRIDCGQPGFECRCAKPWPREKETR
jgi:hypothetical protein